MILITTEAPHAEPQQFYTTVFECASSLYCFICRDSQTKGCWTSEVGSVLTSKQQVKSGAVGVLKVSATEIKHFLVSELWCHYTSPQLAWSYNSTKHGTPSVCIACSCLICACASAMRRRRGGYIFFGTSCSTVLINERKGIDLLHCASNLQRGFYIPCVQKMAADLIYPHRPLDSLDVKQMKKGSYFKQIRGQIRRTQVWNLIQCLSVLRNLTVV